MSRVRPEIFKHWVHSREEDKEGTKVYRPSDYDFPPARGRKGFEIKEDGEFIKYEIAPDDRLKPVVGHWKEMGEDKIRVEFEGAEQESFTLDIVSVDDRTLNVKSSK
jgi:hypothetical protein